MKKFIRWFIILALVAGIAMLDKEDDWRINAAYNRVLTHLVAKEMK